MPDAKSAVAVALKEGGTGRVVAVADGDSGTYDQPRALVNFVIARAAAGEQLRVCAWAVRAGASSARIVVTGSGFEEGRKGEERCVDGLDHLNTVGPHQAKRQ